ncbi:hypothetical protein BJX63DRAFT_76762 [Aspergillus granulosus]|uniref:Uncharacterized protein n=1 Tax=Aspergillus granulosus TaxID=176169 RepID=A0ABR4GXY0_9EURO
MVARFLRAGQVSTASLTRWELFCGVSGAVNLLTLRLGSRITARSYRTCTPYQDCCKPVEMFCWGLLRKLIIPTPSRNLRPTGISTDRLSDYTCWIWWTEKDWMRDFQGEVSEGRRRATSIGDLRDIRLTPNI